MLASSSLSEPLQNQASGATDKKLDAGMVGVQPEKAIGHVQLIARIGRLQNLYRLA
jgi:hypothetical protein